MKCMEVTLQNARSVMAAPDGQLIMSANRFGKGNLLFTTPRYMVNTSNLRRPLPAIKQIVKAVADEVSPVKVEGDVLHLFNRMPDGTWKIILINGKGVEKKPDGSKDIIHPEYAAEVRLTVKDGTDLSAEDVYAGRTLVRNGKTFSFTLPSGGVSVIDLKGVKFEDAENSAWIGSEDYFRKHSFVRKPVKKKFVPDAAPCKVPHNKDRGVLLEYTFDHDSNGVIHDGSKNKINGRAVNVSYIPEGRGKAAGVSGKNGTYIEILLPQRDFYSEGTFELWMRPERSQNNRSIFCGSSGFYLESVNDSWNIMTFAANYLQKVDYGKKIDYGKWQHVAVAWKDFSVKLYVDGKELMPADGRFTVLDNFFPAGKFYLGTHNYAPGFNGNSKCAFSYFRILGREMSPGEIAERSEYFKNSLK